MPKNNDYWKKRQKELQRSLLEPADKYCDELEKAYKSTIKDIEKEIAVWYQRFADNNGIIDKAEAKKILNNKELKELKWDVEQYIKAGEENGVTKNWAKELENASARYHISRLDALKIQTQQKIEELYGGREDKVKSLLGDAYTEGNYKNAYEIARKTGANFNFAKIDDNKLNKVLSKPWTTDNNTFSDRIWQNRVTLVNTVHQELIKGISRGSSSIDIAKAISKKMDSDLWQTQRLVVTESAFFASEAQKDCYNSLDVEKYQVLGTLDSTTCSECGNMDGQVFDTKDMLEGVNAPPFHPNCRCTTVPYFDDEFTEGEMRATRDDEGKTTYINDMSYKEWKEKYVVNDVEKSAESGIIKSEHNYQYIQETDLPSWRKSVAKCSEEDYKQIYSHGTGGYIRTPNSFKINAALRNKAEDTLSDDDKLTISTLKRVISENATDRDIILDRYVDANYIKSNFGFDPEESGSIEKLVNRLSEEFRGTLLVDKGFISTSFSENNVFTWRPIKLKIQAPKGTNMFATRNHAESEVILNRGTKMKLISATKNGNNQIELVLEIQNEV